MLWFEISRVKDSWETLGLENFCSCFSVVVVAQVSFTVKVSYLQPKE